VSNRKLYSRKNDPDNDYEKRGRTLRSAFTASLPVMAGYVVLGFGFGVLLTSKGYSWVWALAMSVLIYAGSMQFIAIDLLSGGASLITTALMTLMVNARHLFYGISMLDRYKGTGRKKPYLIFALTDETFSIVCSTDPPEGTDRNAWFFLLSLFNHSYWIFGSVLGAVFAGVVSFNSVGIDFSMTALFVVVFVQQWLDTKDHTSAVAGLACSVLCLLIFGPDRFVIPSMVMIAAVLLLLKGFAQRIPGKGGVRRP